MRNSFIVNQKTLVAILSSMQPICGKRTSLEATSYILFHVSPRELVLKSTDLEISLQASCVLQQSAISQEEKFLVQGKRVFDLVKELDDEIEFMIVDNQLFLTSHGVKVALNLKEAHEFPVFPERIENIMELDASVLLAMLNQVAFLIPQNNANVSLNGLYWEIGSDGLKMTTTDGHCLVQAITPLYQSLENIHWLIPKRAVFELKKLIESSSSKMLFVGLCGNQLVFSGEAFNFFTKLLGEAFPHYQAILERKDFVEMHIDRNRFVKTLKRSACLLSGQFIATTFTFHEDSAKVCIENKEVGKLEEYIPLALKINESLQIRFYAPYLLQGLQMLTDDVVRFFLKNQSKPIIFQSTTEKYSVQYLVMPVSPVSS